MSKNTDVLILIPACNEEHHIGEVLDGIQRYQPGLDVVVVNDGSVDHTSEIAQQHGAQLIALPFHMGYGTAVQTGYKYALREGYIYVVQLDGDGQHDPAQVGRVLEALQKDRADIVIGSRFLKGLEPPLGRYKGPWMRRIGMKLFGALATLIIGQRITDPTSGYIGLNRRALYYLCGDVYPADYPDADVIIMLHKAGFRIVEVPVRMYSNRGGGQLHRGMRPFYYVIKMSLSIFVTLLRKA